MQYKIPVQIENDDPIFLGLSLKQLTILMIGGAIGYSIFKGLVSSVGPEVAAFPAIIIGIFTLVIALFKVSEMTFIPYILNLIRQYINSEAKIWVKGVDSFSLMDIGYVVKKQETKTNDFDISEKEEKLKNLKEKLEHI